MEGRRKSQPQCCSLTHLEMLVKETKIFKLTHRFAHDWIDDAKLRFFLPRKDVPTCANIKYLKLLA